MANKFTKVMSNLSESNQSALKNWNENPQDLHTTFNEWAAYAVNCIVQEVEDPIHRVQVLRESLK